jgi:hypothetical protein
MPKPEQNDPRDAAVAALKRAFQEIERADQQLPRANETSSKPEVDPARQPGQRMRLGFVRRISSRSGLALYGLIGLLLVSCLGASAIAFWLHDHRTNQVIAKPAPQVQLTSSSSVESPAPAPSRQPSIQASASAPELPAPAGSPSTDTVAAIGQAELVKSTAADRAALELEVEQLRISIEQLKTSQEHIVRAEVAEQLKTAQEQLVRENAAFVEQLKKSQEQMVRDNAALAERLKASEEQMIRDNAAAAEQLKASQEQVASLIAKTSDRKSRARTAAPRATAPPLRPIATPTGRPASASQVRAQGRSAQQ